MKIESEKEFLSKTDITSVISPIDISKYKERIHFIYNTEYQRPIAYTSSLTALNSMFQRYSLNSYVIYNANKQINEYGKKLLPEDWDNTKGWEWKYDFKLRSFVYDPQGLTWDDRYYFKCLFEKSICLQIINDVIHRFRRSFVSEISFQNIVYKDKEKESQIYLQKKENNEYIDEKEFPYLMQYVKITGSDPEVAAREISFQADITNKALIESEFQRLKYSRFILDCDSISDFKGIINNFKETIRYDRT